MPRATSSGTISFGLVSIPVKLYTACASENVRFVSISPKTKARLKQKMYDPTNDEEVLRADILKGYEISKNQFIIFTPAEVKSLEADRTNTIDILEFVPTDSVDLVSVEKTYYLGPDKGGDKAYRLISEALKRKDSVAVGRWAARGKTQLVIIRSYNDGLILHQMYYSKEVRSFDEIMEVVAKFDIQDREMALAEQLIEQMSTKAFDASQYVDEYAQRVLDAVNTKQAGGELALDAPIGKAPVLDMFEALKASLDKAAKKPIKEKKPATKKGSAKKRKAS